MKDPCHCKLNARDQRRRVSLKLESPSSIYDEETLMCVFIDSLYAMLNLVLLDQSCSPSSKVD